jgi:hypothetical protein
MKIIKLKSQSGQTVVIKTDDTIKNQHKRNKLFLTLFYESILKKKLVYTQNTDADITELLVIIKSIVPKKYHGFFLDLTISYTGWLTLKLAGLVEWYVAENGNQILFGQNAATGSCYIVDIQNVANTLWREVFTGKPIQDNDTDYLSDHLTILSVTE